MSTLKTEKMNMESPRATPRSAFSEAKENLVAVREDLSKLKEDAMGAVAGAADGAMQTARQGADAARDLAKRAAERAASEARYASDQISQFISNRPTTAVLIALGVGAILGRMLMSSRR